MVQFLRALCTLRFLTFFSLVKEVPDITLVAAAFVTGQAPLLGHAVLTDALQVQKEVTCASVTLEYVTSVAVFSVEYLASVADGLFFDVLSLHIALFANSTLIPFVAFGACYAELWKAGLTDLISAIVCVHYAIWKLETVHRGCPKDKTHQPCKHQYSKHMAARLM